MDVNDNKKLVDELFGTLEGKLKASAQAPQSVQPTGVDGQVLTMRELLNRAMEDYDRKLGTNMGLRDMGPTKFHNLVTTLDGLPFMAHALFASTHFAKQVGAFQKLCGADLSDLKDQVFVPALMVCAGMVQRIHALRYAPDLDVHDFDVSRIDANAEQVYEVVEHIKEVDSDNRRKWIGMLCYDMCMTLINTTTSILEDRMNNPMGPMLFRAMFVQAASNMTVAFIRNMVTTSQALDSL